MSESQVTIDRFGRIVIPKSMRTELGLSAGSILLAEEVTEGILLKPAQEPPELIDDEGVLVFTGTATEDVTEAVDKHRATRLSTLHSPRRAGRR